MVKAKVIVFEKSGDILLGTLIDSQKEIGMKNLTGLIRCPNELLDCVPEEIKDFCMKTARQYLYFNSEGKLESCKDPIPV